MPDKEKRKEIIIDGVIGWDVMSNDIRAKLDEAGGEDVTAIITSPGGFVFSGLTIYNLFKNYPGKTTAKIQGLAASMASYIPMAFDEVVVEDNAVFMIHNARQGMAGDHNDMRKAANLLERLSGMLAKAYVNKTGKSEQKIKKMMDEETYLFGEEIVKAGFADKVIKTESGGSKAEAVEFARAMFDDCMATLKSDGQADLEKAAAMLPATEIKNEIETEIESTNKSEPAPAGENKSEVKMTLHQILSENPEAKAEYEEKLKAGESELKARIEAAKPYLAPESVYGNAIKNKALKVITGEASIEALQDMVALVDELTEKKKSDAAKAESAKIADITAEQSEINGDESREEEAKIASVISQEVI